MGVEVLGAKGCGKSIFCFSAVYGGDWTDR